MLQQLITTIETKRDALLVENETLRKQFDSIQQQIQRLNRQYKKTVQLFLTQYVVHKLRCKFLIDIVMELDMEIHKHEYMFH